MEEWPLSLKELYAAKALLYRKMSFLDVAKRCAHKITPCYHKDFTHTCACPFHAGGEERTPSLYFSEKTKVFHCFSCDAHGDLFDFIGFIEGRPWNTIVRDLVDTSNIEESEIQQAEFEMNTVSYDVIYEISFDLSLMLRDYLSSLVKHPLYADETLWVDRTFKKIDERFRTIEDAQWEEAKSFRMQICVELERRKSLVARKYENRSNR